MFLRKQLEKNAFNYTLRNTVEFKHYGGEAFRNNTTLKSFTLTYCKNIHYLILSFKDSTEFLNGQLVIEVSVPIYNGLKWIKFKWIKWDDAEKFNEKSLKKDWPKTIGGFKI